MQDPLVALQESAERALATARELALFRAFARSHGVAEVSPPKEKTREVTGEDTSAITKRRADVSELVWLHHERDAVCVERGLTPDQVAGVLAAATRASNGSTSANHANPGTPHKRVRTRGVTADPATWPERPLEASGTRTRPPKRRQYAADPDDLDHQIVLVVREACDAGKGDWSALSRQIACVRRLWPHTIAGMVARARQLGQLPAK